MLPLPSVLGLYAKNPELVKVNNEKNSDFVKYVASKWSKFRYAFCIKSMFNFVDWEATICWEHLIFNGFRYVSDILKTSGQVNRTIVSYRNKL